MGCPMICWDRLLFFSMLSTGRIIDDILICCNSIDIFRRGVGHLLCQTALQLEYRIVTWRQHFPPTCRVFAHLADHREWEAELTKGFHRDRSRYKKNKPWQKKRKWQRTNVPNAALASDSLEKVWTCSMWAMMLDLDAFIPGMLRAKRASSAGDLFRRFQQVWVWASTPPHFAASEVWETQLWGEPVKRWNAELLATCLIARKKAQLAALCCLGSSKSISLQ